MTPKPSKRDSEGAMPLQRGVGRSPAVFNFISVSEEATLSLGRALAAALVPGVTALLYGDLGAGKTTLVRGICGALGITKVRSPSFTLVNEYRSENFHPPVVHADLYRLEPEGVDDLGLEEYVDAGCVLLVEWPGRWKNQPDSGVLKIFIEAVSENERAFEIYSLGGAADTALQNLREAIEDGETNYTGVGLQPALD